MSQVVHCHEADALPPRVALSVEMGGALAVYMLEDAPGASSTAARPAARATILRRAGELAPAGAHLLFEAELGESGRHRILRITRVGRVPVDILRQDGRSRLFVGTELRSGARLTVDTIDREAVSFSLSLAAQAAQGLRASVGAGGTRSSQAASAQATLLWVVPSFIEVLRDPLDDVKDGAVDWLRESGISPRTFSAVLVVGFGMLASGGFGITQYFAAEEAKAELVDARAEATAAEAAKQAALDAEATCIVDRRALAAAANARDEERRAAVEGAFGRTAARAMAEGRGGARYRAAAVAAFDEQAFEADLAAVLGELDAASATVEGTTRCRGFDRVLERDLPAYVLTVHPDPEMACPASYLAYADGTSRRGSWGLSDRALLELAGAAAVTGVSGEGGAGGEAPVEGFDARDVDRHGAAMLAAGVRAVRSALLEVDVGARPAVAPSELDLWALALFDAGSRMPPPAPGAPAKTVAGCAADLVLERAAAARTPAPGEPVLPSVASIAAGTEAIRPSPTAGCAWPDGAVARGAQVALRAVARTAVVPPETAVAAMEE